MRRTLKQITNCNDCGACCTGQEALPVGYYLSMLGNVHRHKLPADLLAELNLMAEEFNREGWPCNGEPCVWYDAESKRCRHYEHRPSICRDEVNPGDNACRKWRKEVGIV